MKVFIQLGTVLNDRDYVDSYSSIGTSYTGLITKRDRDLLGISVNLVKFNKSVVYINSTHLIRNESVIEIFYKAKFFKHLTVQPDLQYVINPASEYGLNNALIFNLRAKLEI